MDLAMIGLGKMGGNMAERLVRAGHRVVGFDLDETARVEAASAGVETAAEVEAAVAVLPIRSVELSHLPSESDNAMQLQDTSTDRRHARHRNRSPGIALPLYQQLAFLCRCCRTTPGRAFDRYAG